VRTALVMRAALALVAVVGLGGTGCSKDSNPTQPAPAADVTIEITANNGASSFSPSPAVVTVGQTVAWHNAHSMTHTATADGGGFDTGDIAPGATSQPITMSTQGTFAYHCSRHPSMVGTLTVDP
jgi:plastocyanin